MSYILDISIRARIPNLLKDLQRELRMSCLKRGNLIRDHVQIAAAILAGKPLAALRAMRRYRRHGAEIVPRLPDSAFGENPSWQHRRARVPAPRSSHAAEARPR